MVGRVFINNGFGIPNARVSIFIPIDDIDKNDPIINGLYPYELVTDKDIDGKRYNLLPKNSETDNDCFTPVGTFQLKEKYWMTQKWAMFIVNIINSPHQQTMLVII